MGAGHNGRGTLERENTQPWWEWHKMKGAIVQSYMLQGEHDNFMVIFLIQVM